MKYVCDSIVTTYMTAQNNVIYDVFFNAVINAKTNAMISDEDIKSNLKQIFGDDAYNNVCQISLAAEYFSEKRFAKVISVCFYFMRLVIMINSFFYRLKIYSKIRQV